MKCCICNKEIEKQYAPGGEMYWDKGHNPAPIRTGEEDRCCGACNEQVVLPKRWEHIQANFSLGLGEYVRKLTK